MITAPFFVPATNAFLEAGILAGIMSPVGVPDGPELFDVGFPMDISCRIELGDLVLWAIHLTESADRTVRDVTRDPLATLNERDMVGPIERTVVDLSNPEIFEVQTLFHHGQLIGFPRIGRMPGRGLIQPTRTAGVFPVGPWHAVAVVSHVELKSQSQLPVVLTHWVRETFSFAVAKAGKSIPARMATMAITTRSSISVKVLTEAGDTTRWRIAER